MCWVQKGGRTKNLKITRYDPSLKSLSSSPSTKNNKINKNKIMCVCVCVCSNT
jgi:hypothetical protein